MSWSTSNSLISSASICVHSYVSDNADYFYAIQASGVLNRYTGIASTPTNITPAGSIFPSTPSNNAIAGSADGQYIYIIYNKSTPDEFVIGASSNFGASFLLPTFSGAGASGLALSIACSSSGQYVYILTNQSATYGNGKLLISSNYGADFTGYPLTHINSSFGVSDQLNSSSMLCCDSSGQYLYICL